MYNKERGRPKNSGKMNLEEVKKKRKKARNVFSLFNDFRK